MIWRASTRSMSWCNWWWQDAIKGQWIGLHLWLQSQLMLTLVFLRQDFCQLLVWTLDPLRSDSYGIPVDWTAACILKGSGFWLLSDTLSFGTLSEMWFGTTDSHLRSHWCLRHVGTIELWSWRWSVWGFMLASVLILSAVICVLALTLVCVLLFWL